jgi:hypothetical protein
VHDFGVRRAIFEDEQHLKQDLLALNGMNLRSRCSSTIWGKNGGAWRKKNQPRPNKAYFTM